MSRIWMFGLILAINVVYVAAFIVLEWKNLVRGGDVSKNAENQQDKQLFLRELE